MKELDFLPQWYKDDQRRQSHVRRQYIALAFIFLAMMAFNLTATHRANRAAATVADFENQRLRAETVVYEFNVLAKQLNELRAKADLMERIDPRVDIAAILAEMGQIVGESIVLRRAEIHTEPFAPAAEKERKKGSAIRPASRTASTEKATPLGAVKFKIVIAGVAARPEDATDLVCQLEASSYFQRVHLSFYGSAKIQVGARSAASPQDTLEVTEFEITCYVANYKETGE
ncbi:MAG: hypothetical protein A2Y76_02380 [Planctomycetes bacterium RBG_13_60_9]|nr:MAG: hypothetical protein A2Y76_02380 [Planctomycetes bacterium RBG_13_60_9]